MEKEKLTLFDVVALARAGYKRKDVEELIEASKAPTEPDIVTEPAADKPKEQPAEDKSVKTEPKESLPPADAVDYKAMYEAEKAKVDDLQNKFNRQDVSGAADQDVDLVALVREFC